MDGATFRHETAVILETGSFDSRIFPPRVLTKFSTVRRNAIRATQRRQDARIAHTSFFLTRLVRHGISDIYNRDEAKFQNREKICILGGIRNRTPVFRLGLFFHSRCCFTLWSVFRVATTLMERQNLREPVFKSSHPYMRESRSHETYSLFLAFVLIVTNNATALFQKRH